MIAKSSLLGAVAIATAATALVPSRPQTETLRYQLDGVTFESVLVHHGKADARLPGILMVPNWMGPTQASLDKAIEIAGAERLVMMVDMYGVGTRPADAAEAGAAAGALRGDRKTMRARAGKALEVLRAEGPRFGLDPERIAAIGFCFGGGTVLELGRAGADLDAIASFHGDLKSPTLAADAGATKARVLVMHGADDPYVAQEDVQAFVAAMRATDVDWQLVQFGNTVHSYTDPAAASDGARYDARSARRAFALLDGLLAEVWRR